MRHLAQAGFRPLLLDWGEPGGRERGYAVGDYVRGPAAGALRAARPARRPAPGPARLLHGRPAGAGARDLARRPRPRRAGAAGHALGLSRRRGRLPPDPGRRDAPRSPRRRRRLGYWSRSSCCRRSSRSSTRPRWSGKFARFADLEPGGRACGGGSSRSRTGCSDGVPLAGPVAQEMPLALVRGQPAGEGPVGAGRPAGPARSGSSSRPSSPSRATTGSCPPPRPRRWPPACRRRRWSGPSGGHVSMVVGQPPARGALASRSTAWLRRIAQRGRPPCPTAPGHLL